eukprot:Amastigsp_a847190_26.p6 type:complete len:133 gc:universal Amastigsp_a847190_26:1465-1863(+)
MSASESSRSNVFAASSTGYALMSSRVMSAYGLMLPTTVQSSDEQRTPIRKVSLQSAINVSESSLPGTLSTTAMSRHTVSAGTSGMCTEPSSENEQLPLAGAPHASAYSVCGFDVGATLKMKNGSWSELGPAQ